MKEQRNTLSGVEMGLDNHHKGISSHPSATTKRVSQKSTSADKFLVLNIMKNGKSTSAVSI